jgi:DNA mismatch endonuclease, patch repair protein
LDILTIEKRSALMSRIRSKDTAIELVVRYALHGKGLRYRLGGVGLPGRPDLVFPRYRAVVFVHGCFWHGHDCHLFRLPKTRTQFWHDKIESNRLRDRRALEKLTDMGWHVYVVWECSLRGICELERDIFLDGLAMRIRSGT